MQVKDRYFYDNMDDMPEFKVQGIDLVAEYV